MYSCTGGGIPNPLPYLGLLLEVERKQQTAFEFPYLLLLKRDVQIVLAKLNIQEDVFHLQQHSLVISILICQA